MSEDSGLKKALKESNAIGWIAFFILVIGIGVGTIMFGSAPENAKTDKTAEVSGSK